MPILLSIPFQPAAKITAKIRDQGKLPPARTRHRPGQRPLHERVMFGERVDWAILSGPLALHRAKRFWWSGYAIAGVCGLRVILFAAPRRFCFGQPELSGGAGQSGASSWHRHCAIPQAAVGDQPAPALFPRPQGGSMTGGCSHGPVTVASRTGRPG